MIPMRYNPLHDLESLWWVAVYFVLKREVHETTSKGSEREEEAEWDREKQRKYADGVFYSEAYRCRIILIPNSFFNNALRIVHPKMHPAVAILDGLRGCQASCLV